MTNTSEYNRAYYRRRKEDKEWYEKKKQNNIAWNKKVYDEQKDKFLEEHIKELNRLFKANDIDGVATYLEKYFIMRFSKSKEDLS